MGFRHEALLYEGPQRFVDVTAPFIRDGVAAGEPVLVVVAAEKIDWLREELGADAAAVRFADMSNVGTNPARIIPAWRDFVAECSREGGRFRGVGEPIWPGRSPAELVECQLHESLLNHAFVDAPDWWLVCPYDAAALDQDVLAEAERSHPFVAADGASRVSGTFPGLEGVIDGFDEPLAEPGVAPQELTFAKDSLAGLRQLVSRRASEFGLHPTRAGDLVVAVTELASNSVRYGGGEGVVLFWSDDETLCCEVRDRGWIDDPLVGRARPPATSESGRGLWLVNQLCDLVQVRSSASEGTVVRLHMHRA